MSAVGAAVFLAFASFVLQSLALPGLVSACTCVPPGPLADFATEDRQFAIVVGTAGHPVADFQPIHVETWYHGEFPSPEVWVPRGVDDGAACRYALVPGERRFFVLGGPRGEVYETNICLPSAPVETDEGQRYLAEAEETFGAGQPPPPSPSPTPAPERPLDLSPLMGEGLVWVVGGVAAAGLLFGLLALAARRRPLS